MSTRVPVNEPVISDESKRNVNAALDSVWLSSSGPFVEKFEKEYAAFVGVKHAVSCTSGTAALHLSLLSLGIKTGDEIIVPAFTMAAVWLSVLYTGARPVFVDCDSDTFNINPALIEEKITARTKAIIVVHTFGQTADMDSILAVANKHKLPVIEDAAEAHGAEYKGRRAGGLGTIGAFSFYANKIITTGEGGMVVTNDDEIADRARRFKDLCHSKTKRFIHDGIGFNYRMTNIQAAIGLGELRSVDQYIEKKRWMAREYEKRLSNIPGLTLPKEVAGTKNVHWVYALTIDSKRFGMTKDDLRKKLSDAGVETRDFFYPPEDQPILREYIRGEKYPNAAQAAQNGLYLPSGLALTETQIECVSEQIARIAKK